MPHLFLVFCTQVIAITQRKHGRMIEHGNEKLSFSNLMQRKPRRCCDWRLLTLGVGRNYLIIAEVLQLPLGASNSREFCSNVKRKDPAGFIN